MKALATFNYVV